MFGLRTAAIATRRTAVRCFSTEIPINKVARVVRMHVGDEANAIECDKVVQEAKSILTGVPGYVGLQRTVCKAEWAYEVAVIFDSLDNFKVLLLMMLLLLMMISFVFLDFLS
jgi:antibiotic biosynthesis monooxygenase (ABM) superfamily enzyme